MKHYTIQALCVADSFPYDNPKTIRKLLVEGKLKGDKMPYGNGVWQIPEEAVENYLAEYHSKGNTKNVSN